MKKHFSMKKMATLALVIVCVSVPLTSFAHKTWCAALHCVAGGTVAVVIEGVTVKTTTSTTYSCNGSTHKKIVTTTKTCSLCSDEWVYDKIEYSPEKHTWKCIRQKQGNGCIIKTYECPVCGRRKEKKVH